jgi:CubicO group peptidase (beta-lactamase class C family)
MLRSSTAFVLPIVLAACASGPLGGGAPVDTSRLTGEPERKATTPPDAVADRRVDDLRRRPLATWSHEERVFGFANWDRIYPARTVARGKGVLPLPQGAPLQAFAPGGAGVKELQQSIDKFQLAGIVVLHDGKVRLERYALGHSADGRWVSFSIAKSVTSTLVGAAIRDGLIATVDDSVTRYVPELRDSAYDGVTLRQLLTMTSGAKWNEDYADPGADVAQFYSAPIDPGTDATVSYMRRLERAVPPGQKWHYNTGETNLIGVVLARATGKSLSAYASEKIWARYGMEQDASWMLDRSGNEHGGCCMHATTRDYARLGQFILEGARVDGQSIVADGWLEAATRKQVDIGQPGAGYGYQWWTRDTGTFNAYGIHGQQVHVDPTRRLVVAVNSAWPVAAFTKDMIVARTALFDAIRRAIDSESHGSADK